MRGLSPAAIVASLAINAVALLSVEHATTNFQSKLMQEESLKVIEGRNQAQSLAFEFIEAPSAPAKRHPRRTRRISDRDSVNQDMSGAKNASPDEGPRAKLGVSDQLAQQEGGRSSAGSQAAQAHPAQPLTEDKKTSPTESEDASMGSQEIPEISPSKEQAEEKKSTKPPSPATAASPAIPVVQGMPSRDRITAAEMTRTQSMGAQLQGQASFEAMGSDMGAYVRRVKEKIWRAWYPYVMSNYPRDYKTADAMVGFVIDAEGNLKSVAILDSHGSQLFAAFCVEAVQTSSPFGVPPKEALLLSGKDELEIRFGFHYR